MSQSATMSATGKFSYTAKNNYRYSNLFPRWVYERAGFTCRRHLLKKDELLFFFLLTKCEHTFIMSIRTNVLFKTLTI